MPTSQHTCSPTKEYRDTSHADKDESPIRFKGNPRISRLDAMLERYDRPEVSRVVEDRIAADLGVRVTDDEDAGDLLEVSERTPRFEME